MIYARIDLVQTDYLPLKADWQIISHPEIHVLNKIYQKYCEYKKFRSVMPIFDSEYLDSKSEIIGYYDNNMLIAFSLIKKHDKDNVEAVQFAWTYSNPKLRLGIVSLKHECALYKQQGYKFLYLGEASEYKSKIAGYEVLGPKSC
jgi:hypothetical protein